MMPQIGQHVKCILRNGAIAEGLVEEWANNTVQLRSLDRESILIITHPAEDIMLIKIILEKVINQDEEIPEPPLDYTTKEARQELRDSLAIEDLQEQFQTAAETANPYDSDDLKSLAQLRIELNKQERRIIAEKLKDHRPHRSAYQPSTTPYHYPSIVTGKPSPYKPRIPNGQSRSNKKPSP